MSKKDSNSSYRSQIKKDGSSSVYRGRIISDAEDILKSRIKYEQLQDINERIEWLRAYTYRRRDPKELKTLYLQKWLLGLQVQPLQKSITELKNLNKKLMEKPKTRSDINFYKFERLIDSISKRIGKSPQSKRFEDVAEFVLEAKEVITKFPEFKKLTLRPSYKPAKPPKIYFKKDELILSEHGWGMPYVYKIKEIIPKEDEIIYKAVEINTDGTEGKEREISHGIHDQKDPEQHFWYYERITQEKLPKLLKKRAIGEGKIIKYPKMKIPSSLFGKTYEPISTRVFTLVGVNEAGLPLWSEKGYESTAIIPYSEEIVKKWIEELK